MTHPSGSRPAGGAPVGPASGDLVGSYPTPTVARVRGRLWSSQAPNVDDVVVWDGNEWVPMPMFGAELVEATRFSPVTTSNAPTSPVSYLALGTEIDPIPLVASHRYIALTSYAVSVSASNTSHWADVRLNGAPSTIGPMVEPLGEANAQTLRSNAVTFLGSQFGSSIRYDLVFAKSSGTGSVTLRSATLAIWRIS